MDWLKIVDAFVYVRPAQLTQIGQRRALVNT